MTKLLLGATLFAMLASAATANEGHKLSEQEVVSLLSDADLDGSYPDGRANWSEKTTAGGHVLDLTNHEVEVGSWGASENRTCYIYFRAPPAIACFDIYQSDDTILFYDVDTDTLIATAHKRSQSQD